MPYHKHSRIGIAPNQDQFRGSIHPICFPRSDGGMVVSFTGHREGIRVNHRDIVRIGRLTFDARAALARIVAEHRRK